MRNIELKLVFQLSQKLNLTVQEILNMQEQEFCGHLALGMLDNG